MSLHIYSQPSWHLPARIYGTKADIENLITTLQRSLTEAPLDTGFVHGEFECADGEGYDVMVRVVDEEMMHQLKMPYTDI